jgi:hypothetical protein
MSSLPSFSDASLVHQGSCAECYCDLGTGVRPEFGAGDYSVRHQLCAHVLLLFVLLSCCVIL